MEIERKYLITHIPFDIAGYPFHQIEQAYLSTAPVVRVRQEDDTYYLTYKSKGLMAREEYNLPLTKESYEHLRSKADGRILTKKRYLIPMEGTEYTIELDIFLGEYEGLKLAEVEFPSEEAALAFVPPEWFGREVTFTGEYQNSRLVLAENLVLKTKEQYKGILLMIKQVMNWIKTHRYCLAGLYMLVFLSGFFLLELHEPSDVHIIHCAVDDLIPFNEWFVLPYFLWYAWVPVFMIYFMIKDREAYLRLCFVMFAGATFCLFVYLLAPNGLNLRQEITSQNFCAQIVRFLRSVDPPNNVCPSIHVSSTVAVHLTICHAASVRNKKPIRTLSWIVTILICLSTMFIKQHSLVDVLCGWILSLILDEIVNVWVLVKAFSKGKNDCFVENK